MKIDHNAIQKILIIQLRAIGDVVLTTPVITVLKKQYPHAKISFLTSGAIAPILRDIPGLDHIIPYNFSSASVVGLMKMTKLVQKEKFDLIIDFQVSPGTAKIVRNSRAKIRLGWHIRHRHNAYNFLSDANKMPVYVPRQKCMALQQIGINEIDEKTRVSYSDKAKAVVENYLKENEVFADNFKINITPLGKRQAREWEHLKIAELTDALIFDYGATVFYNFMPSERVQVEKIAKTVSGNVHLLPAWNLETFTAFLAEADLHISYDNGPKHLAIACGTPTIALFATDPPVLWNPIAEANHPFILSNVNCRFCGLRSCELKVCTREIQVADILEKMQSIPKIQLKLKSTAL